MPPPSSPQTRKTNFTPPSHTTPPFLPPPNLTSLPQQSPQPSELTFQEPHRPLRRTTSNNEFHSPSPTSALSPSPSPPPHPPPHPPPTPSAAPNPRCRIPCTTLASCLASCFKTPPTPASSTHTHTHSHNMPEFQTPDPVKPPLLKSLRGRQAIFAAWLHTAPFVKSFVEEEERGNAKKTRSNTLANRRNTPAYSAPVANYIQSNPPLSKKVSHSTADSSHDSKSSASTFSSSSASDLHRAKRNITFANEVQVYADVKEAVPVVKKVRSHPDGSSKFIHRFPTARVLNQFAPTSTAGKWLERKTSSDTTTHLA